MRRVESWIEAMKSHAVADAMVCSKSFARRRFRLSHASVRSTTQRRGSTSKPFAASGLLMVSMVHLPQLRSASLKLICGIAAISEHVAQPGEALDDCGEHQRCAIAVLDVGGVDYGVNEIAVGGGEDVALASLDLLACVIAPKSATFRCFHRLAVDHACTWRSLTACFSRAIITSP